MNGEAQRHRGSGAEELGDGVLPTPPSLIRRGWGRSTGESVRSVALSRGFHRLCASVPLCLCAFLLLAVPGAFASGESAPDLYSRANQAFAGGKYAEAIRDYDVIAARDGVSAPLLFNLANACYRDGRIGRAILCYERARWLAPRDSDIEANLRLVRKTSGLYAADAAWWQEMAGRLSLDGWTLAASIAWCLLCLLLAVRLLFRGSLEGRRSPWRVAALALALALALSIFGLAARAAELERAVVLTADAPLRISPYDTATAAGTLAAGETLRVQKRYGSYFYVRTQQGRMGWVADSQVEKIVR